jgi:hypothetical protein
VLSVMAVCCLVFGSWCCASRVVGVLLAAAPPPQKKIHATGSKPSHESIMNGSAKDNDRTSRSDTEVPPFTAWRNSFGGTRRDWKHREPFG